MNYGNVFRFNAEWNYKTVTAFLALALLPNLAGFFNLGTVWGFKIHFFQFAVFTAALAYGPKGGLLAGAAGSAYPALLMGNPYILGGNAILGYFTGVFARKGLSVLPAALAAYAIQLPWLVATDYYLMHLPMSFIKPLVVALLISNAVGAVAAHYLARRLKASVLN